MAEQSGTEQVTVTLTFDRDRLQEAARRFAMLRQEPYLPISTADLRAALDADPPPPLHGHNRTLAEVREWITERRASEVKGAPKNQNTPAAGMTMGSLETLDALSAYLNGDDDA